MAVLDNISEMWMSVIRKELAELPVELLKKHKAAMKQTKTQLEVKFPSLKKDEIFQTHFPTWFMIQLCELQSQRTGGSVIVVDKPDEKQKEKQKEDSILSILDKAWIKAIRHELASLTDEQLNKNHRDVMAEIKLVLNSRAEDGLTDDEVFQDSYENWFRVAYCKEQIERRDKRAAAVVVEAKADVLPQATVAGNSAELP